MRNVPFLMAVGVTFVISTVSSSAAQSPPAQSKKPPKVISLSGCLQRDDTAPDQFTIDDPKAGTYRVSGKDFREFMGRRVQLDGGVVVKGLVIKGGLQPNPNIAGQAGALDPSRAAVQAATSGGSTNTNANTSAPEFRVKTIHPTDGVCP